MALALVKSKEKDYGVISQKELRDFYGIEQQYLDARARYQAQMAKIALRINSGAKQEPGKYSVQKKITWRRRVAYKEIVIKLKGKQYVENLLANAPKKAYSHLEFADIGRN